MINQNRRLYPEIGVLGEKIRCQLGMAGAGITSQPHTREPEQHKQRVMAQNLRPSIFSLPYGFAQIFQCLTNGSVQRQHLRMVLQAGTAFEFSG